MKHLFLAVLLVLSIPVTLLAQHEADKGFNSITEAELRNHIFFLASDYMNGRVATSPQYDIACHYVAAEFVAAGLKPVVMNDTVPSFFQGVPFARTVFNDQLNWTISVGGTEKNLAHKTDYKIMMGNKLNHEKVQLVWVGYGIEEKGEKWNDFKDIDLTGKIAVCLAGAPMKKDKPLFSKEINDKYTGDRGLYSKIFGSMFSRGPAAIIIVDPTNSMGGGFDQVPSRFATEKFVYKGSRDGGGMGSFPSIYLVKPDFLDLVMPDANNPNKSPENILANYKPQVLEAFLSSKVEIMKEDEIMSNNVIGMVPGTDPVLKKEYIVIGGHLDHVAPQKGLACNGADDNASGSAGVMEIAEAVAMNPCKRTVVFITYTAEEMGLNGSSYFLESGLIPKEQIKFNVNLDMIGRTGKGNEATRAHWVVTDKKFLSAITDFIKGVNDGVTDFPILFNDDQHSQGGSDHMTYQRNNIPAFFFFSGVYADLHTPGDDPEKIDYPKAEKVSRLAYLIAEKLGNMDVVPAFQ
jgi:hypothetical protein